MGCSSSKDGQECAKKDTPTQQASNTHGHSTSANTSAVAKVITAFDVIKRIEELKKSHPANRMAKHLTPDFFYSLNEND